MPLAIATKIKIKQDSDTENKKIMRKSSYLGGNYTEQLAEQKFPIRCIRMPILSQLQNLAAFSHGRRPSEVS